MDVTRWRNVARRTVSHRAVRASAALVSVILVAVAGALLGILLGARVLTPIGPAEVRMTLQPSWHGETVVDIRPLGTLRFDTHSGPVRLDLAIDSVSPEAAQQVIDNPRWADRLPETIEADVQEGLRALALRTAACGLGGAVLAGLIVFRRWRRVLWSGLTGLVAIGTVAAVVVASFNPRSIAEPRYTGLLTGVPSLIGDAQSIVSRFSEYRGQLAKLVTNVSRLYEAGATLPLFEPDPDTIRVLHVSDIHLNPVAWNVIRSLKEQFQVDLIIDTGDISDHGTKAENRALAEVGAIDVPYVYVRGNHDSKATQQAMAAQKNVTVLDGRVATVAGLRIYGVGDPRFTPDKSADQYSNAQLVALGQEHAAKVVPPERPRINTMSTSAPERAPVDLVAVHDPTMGRPFSGATALVLAGHTHQRSTELLPTGTRLMIQGSTGGAGLRGLEHEEPTPVQASVLYFSKDTNRLQAWDDITIGGLGEQSVQIQRHLEADPGRTIFAEPVPTPSPAESPVPTPSPAESGSRSPTGTKTPTPG